MIMQIDHADQHPTIIIGAGPAGLAVGACLKQVGVPCLILERTHQIGSAWHQHYDRLHLHTPKAYSSLPFVPFPKDDPRYPSRLQVIHYLETYAKCFELDIQFGQQVVTAHHIQAHWDIQTQNAHYQTPHLVIAAGYTREPHLPHWPGQETFRNTLLHSSQYRNAQPFKNQKVLVVGFGNSGGEIALDLWEQGAKPSLAVRSPVNVLPRELFGIPILAISLMQRWLPTRWADALNAPILRAAIGDLRPFGLRPPPHGPLTEIQHDARIPLIDIGTIKLIQRGQIPVLPGIKRFTEDGIVFTDGKQGRFNAVILATGYRPRVNAFLDAANVYDESGTPLSSGTQTSIPGLYFCGYHVASTGMLREIGLEAQRISVAISAAIARQPRET